MARRSVHTAYSQVAGYPYSTPAFVVPSGHDLVFIQGQVAWNDELRIASTDIKDQATQVFTNMKGIMESSGGSLDDVVHLLIFMTDIDEFEEVNAVRRDFFTGELPPSTAVEVPRMVLPEVRLEIHAVGALSPESAES